MASKTRTSKRLKGEPVDDALTLGKSAKKSGDQPLSPDAEWNQLPYEILLQVFHYLDDNSDKYHAALTCKSWLRPLSAPSIWRTGHFRFYNARSIERAFRFVRLTGKTLRHVTLDCSVAGKSAQDYRMAKEALYEFLAHLINSGSNQLLSLRLTNTIMCISRGCNSIRLLVSLLENQRQLHTLELSHTNFEDAEVKNVLVAVAKNCSSTVHTLELVSAIERVGLVTPHGNLPPVRPEKFMHPLGNFINLTNLGLSYEYLSDDMLSFLAIKTKRLQVMTVDANDYKTAESLTTSRAWIRLKYACPELKVNFFCKPLAEKFFDPALTEFLAPSTPLHTLRWNTGRLISVGNIRRCLQLVATHFRDTLHHVTLESGVRLDADSIGELFKSLHKCKHLETLSIQLTCERSSDRDMFCLAIRDAIAQSPVTCPVTFNGQQV